MRAPAAQISSCSGENSVPITSMMMSAFFRASITGRLPAIAVLPVVWRAERRSRNGTVIWNGVAPRSRAAIMNASA
ncbi:hypothetical protein D3C87_2014430 [compost metagenome]